MRARKYLHVDTEQLHRLAERLGMTESETVRFAVDRLLHEDEVLTAVTANRRCGGLLDVFGRTTTVAAAAPTAR